MVKLSQFAGALRLALAAIALLCASPVLAAVDTVHTDLGDVKGVERNGALEFRGIPYAAPPVGQLRWRAPQPASAWAGVRDASAFGAACPQLHRFNLTDESLNEDCLTVNVSTPLTSTAKPRPVMVWIHGGAFVGGSSNLYRLDKLARDGGLVAVSMNYRIGVLGFMPHKAFAASDNGAYGLEDQRAALRWVQRNIRAFGGDPDNVTLAGESAGGGSICLHLADPAASKGLYAKAIVLSAGCMQDMPSVEEMSSAVGAVVAAKVGCDDPATALECLRRAPLKALLLAGDELSHARILTFAPSIGSRLLPRQAGTAMRAGEVMNVPILMGGARDELSLYVAYAEQAGSHTTAQTYPSMIAGYYGDAAPKVLASYPLSPDVLPPALLGRVLSDFNPVVAINNCIYLQTAATLARKVDIRVFEFADDNAPVLGVGIVTSPDPGFPLGPVHSAALNYIFPNMSNTAKIDAPDLPAPSQALSAQMVALWSRFAATGQPTAPGLDAWPRYAGGRTVLRLRPGEVGLYDAEAAHKCRFWASVYPQRLDAVAQ